MDDEAYARELFAILTNPSPIRISPLGSHGVGGFDRDVRVTSATVVPGEHGAMVEIGYVLDLTDAPDLQGMPAEGSFRLPVAAEWRTASNYDDPADYAPLVAHLVVMQVNRHVKAHQPADRTAADLPGRDEQWAILLEHLGREGATREMSPGRLEVGRRPDGRILTVLVTPDQWEQFLLRHGIDLEPHNHVGMLLAKGQRDQAFLVFWDGDLELSVREALPPVRPWRPLPAVPGAGWYASTPSQDLHEDQGHP